MRSRRDRANTGSNRPPDDENKAARRRARQFRTRFLANDRRRVRLALEADYRDRRRAGRYGISLEGYRALEARQGHACAICRRPSRVLCIDHCHVTGRVRGLLCRKCNSALGFCDDDPRLLRAAMAYLRRTTGE
jgi:Autographiviridae endonuclease VII